MNFILKLTDQGVTFAVAWSDVRSIGQGGSRTQIRVGDDEDSPPIDCDEAFADLCRDWEAYLEMVFVAQFPDAENRR